MTAPTRFRGPERARRRGGPPTVLVVVAVAIVAGLLGIAAAEVGKTALYVVGGIIGIGVLAYSIRDLLGPPLRQAVDRAGASRFPAPPGRTPSTTRSTVTALLGAVAAGLGAWFLAQQGTKVMLAVLGLVLLGAVVWLAWPLVELLTTTPSDAPTRPRRVEPEPPVAYPQPARLIGIALTVVAAGLIAWVAAQMGMKGLIGLVGGVAVVACLIVVRNRALFFTFVTVCSLTVLFHKSFGPQDLQLSGGAPAVYITTFDALMLLLYAIWISEGTFVADVRAAFRRRILWLPLVGILFLLPSLLVASSSWHSLAELVRMGWMYLLFFYLAVRIRTRAMVWAVLGGLTVIAAIEFVVVVLQWKTGGVLGLSFLGVPTQLTARTTDTSTIGRPFGTIIHPVFMGATVGSLSLLGLAIGLSFRRSLIKVAGLAVAALSVVPLYLAHTRAALVAWAVVAGIVVLVSIARRRLAWSTVGKVVIVVLIGAAVFWPQLVNTFEDNFNTGHFSEEVDSRQRAERPGRPDDRRPSRARRRPQQLRSGHGPVREVRGHLLRQPRPQPLPPLPVGDGGRGAHRGAHRRHRHLQRAHPAGPLARPAVRRRRPGRGRGHGLLDGRGAPGLLVAPGRAPGLVLDPRWSRRGLLSHGRVRRLTRRILAPEVEARWRAGERDHLRDPFATRRGATSGANPQPRPGPAPGRVPADRARSRRSKARPEGRPVPAVLADLLRSMPSDPTLSTINALWPRYDGGRAVVGGSDAPVRTTRARPRRRPRWQIGLAAALTAALLSFGLGGASPSGASVPFTMSQLQIVFAARTKPADPNANPPQPTFQGIYRANGDGTGVHLITPAGDPTIYNWPQWALGGSRIVFTKRYGPDLDHNGFGDWENLFIMNADGSGVQQLTDLNYRAVQPKVSADGRSVVFTAANPQYPRYATYRLDLLTLESTNLSQVTQPNGAVDADPKFTPDGRIVVAASTADQTNIDVFNGDGTDRQALTDDKYFNTDAEMSPDMSSIAYSAYRGDHLIPEGTQIDPQNPDDVNYDVENWFITVRNLRTGQSTLLNRGVDCRSMTPASPCQPGDSSGWKPVWTPDGRQVGYSGWLDNMTNCICVVNADGTSPAVVIASTTLRLKWFDWIVPRPAPPSAVPAPLIGSRAVSSELLVSSTDLAHDGALSLHSQRVDMMRKPATGVNDIDTSVIPAPIEGSWSRDRKLVAFVGSVPYDTNHPTPGPAPPPGQQRREHATLNDLDPRLDPRTEVTGSSALKQIFLSKADGSIQQLTDPWTEDWRDGVVTGDARANTDPVLSPDGHYVVFTNRSTLTNESFLLRMDLFTGEVLNLTNGTAGALRVDDASPKWSPDSSQIAFSWTQGTNANIYVMRASDGLEVTHVTDDGATDITPTWSPDGRSIVFSRHDGQISVTPDALATLSGIPIDGWRLMKVDVATGLQRQLTDYGDSPAFKPVYSPDGSRIYFIGLGPKSFDIHQIDAGGFSPPRPVLITPLLNETSIDWK